MHKLQLIRENETHKILWESEIQMHDFIPTRRSDLNIINKKKKKRTYRTVDSSSQ